MKYVSDPARFGSKIVVTGDVTPGGSAWGNDSGLRVVRDILDGVEDVHFSALGSADVVRHRLVTDIVDAIRAVGRHPAGPAAARESFPLGWRWRGWQRSCGGTQLAVMLVAIRVTTLADAVAVFRPFGRRR